MAHHTFRHQLPHIPKASPFRHRRGNSLVTARSVEIQIVQVVDAQVAHGDIEVSLELINIRGRSNLGSDIQFFTRHLLQDFLERLADSLLRITIATGCFQVVHAQFDSTLDGRNRVAFLRLPGDLHAPQ